ncbi:MAG: S4 domain-containing protein [Candidatus Ratteibacteria bacterium]
MAGLVESKSEAKRMIQQNAVKIDGQTISDINAEIEINGKIVKVGKRKFAKIAIV